MKVAKRVGLFFLCFSLILLAGGFCLWAQEDHLAKLGVYRLEPKLDAPEFTLQDLNDTKRSLSDFRGKFVMLNFWATW